MSFSQSIIPETVIPDGVNWFQPELANMFARPGPEIAEVNELDAIRDGAVAFLESCDITVASLPQEEPATMERETGDDKFEASVCAILLGLTKSSTERILKMKISEPDTFISHQYWDFCSSIGVIPSAIEQSFNYCRKTSSMATLGYYDVFPLKMGVDTSPSVKTFSHTAVGKATWFSYRKETCRPELVGINNVLSFYQDGILNTDKMEDPKYIIPRCAGGLAVTNLFNREANGLAYVRAYKSGTYSRVYGTATAELIDYLNLLNSDVSQIEVPLVCQHLRDKQEYLHGTYENKVFVNERKTALPDPLYKGQRNLAFIHSVEQRLVNARILIGRRAASVQFKRSERLRRILFSENTLEEMRFLRKRDRFLREEYEGALHANAAFQRLLRRSGNHLDAAKLLQDGFKMSPNGARNFEREHAQFLSRKDIRVFTLRDVYFPEDMFFRDNVSADAILKVGGIPLRPIGPRGVQFTPTTSRVGLWQIGEGMLQWCNGKAAQLREAAELAMPIPYARLLPIFTENMEWVNDDGGLIASAIVAIKDLPARSSFLWLVSKDGNLAHKIYRTTGVSVAKVNPEDVLSHIREVEELDDISSNWLQERFTVNTHKFNRSHLLNFDLGSMAAELATRDEDQLSCQLRFLDSKNEGGSRSVQHHYKMELRTASRARWYTVN